MVNFGYPYNDIVICKDSTDYLALKLRICVRFASTLNVERVAVLTYDLVICKDSNDCLLEHQLKSCNPLFPQFWDTFTL